MCRNFLSVGILENLVLIVKLSGNFFQIPIFGVPHPKQISSPSAYRAAPGSTLLRD